MSTIAVISDIHGNVPALRAALADIKATGITEVYCLGDLVGYGPDPAGVIDEIRGAGIPTVRGNYDDGIGGRKGDCGCYYATEQARIDGEASYSFTEAAVDDERARWLSELPLMLKLDASGRRVVLTHGSPRKINEYLHADRSDEQLRRIAENVGADVVVVGHTHVPYHRTLQGTGHRIDYINVGSVGKPKDGDPRACWTEIVFSDTIPGGIDALVHRVAYDIDTVQRQMRERGLPETLVNAIASA